MKIQDALLKQGFGFVRVWGFSFKNGAWGVRLSWKAASSVQDRSVDCFFSA